MPAETDIPIPNVTEADLDAFLEGGEAMKDARYAQHGAAVVLLGLDYEAAGHVHVQSKGRLSDLDVLNATIAHLTRVRDELVRLGAAQ